MHHLKQACFAQKKILIEPSCETKNFRINETFENIIAIVWYIYHSATGQQRIIRISIFCFKVERRDAT